MYKKIIKPRIASHCNNYSILLQFLQLFYYRDFILSLSKNYLVLYGYSQSWIDEKICQSIISSFIFEFK